MGQVLVILKLSNIPSAFSLLPVCGSRCQLPGDPAAIPLLGHCGLWPPETVSPTKSFFYKLPWSCWFVIATEKK